MQLMNHILKKLGNRQMLYTRGFVAMFVTGNSCGKAETEIRSTWRMWCLWSCFHQSSNVAGSQR